MLPHGSFTVTCRVRCQPGFLPLGRYRLPLRSAPRAPRRARPPVGRVVRVGQSLEQPCELLVLGDDHVQEVSDHLAAGKAGVAVALLVEVGEDGSVLVEEPPDPEPVDVDDDIAQVGQRLQRRPLSFPGRLAKPARRRSLNGAPHDAGRRPNPLEDRAMLRGHSAFPAQSTRLLFCLTPGMSRAPLRVGSMRLFGAVAAPLLPRLHGTGRFRGYVDFARVASSRAISTVRKGMSALVSPNISPSGDTSQLRPANVSLS